MTALIPTALREKDTIFVAAPAGAVDLKRLTHSIDLLKEQFNFIVPDTIERRHGYLAGGDEERAEELNKALRDPDVRAIWIARGGFGLTRILHLLDPSPIKNDPKPIIGYSDVTALHAWCHNNGLRGIHGPVLSFLDVCRNEDVQQLVQGLLGEVHTRFSEVSLSSVSRAEVSFPTEECELVGGNLCVISHLIGTREQVDVQDKMLFLEDVGEKPYALDRALTHLFASETLLGCKGVMLGEFSQCDTEDNKGWETALKRVNDFGLPCCYDLPVGHGKSNKSFSYGGKVRVVGNEMHLVDPMTVTR